MSATTVGPLDVLPFPVPFKPEGGEGVEGWVITTTVDSFVPVAHVFADVAGAKERALVMAAAPDLLEALEMEDDAYELGLATGMEDWSTCTRIMQKRRLSLELSAEDATDQLTMLARHLRLVAIAKARGEAVAS